LSSRKGISSISFQHYDPSYGESSGEGRVLWLALCIFDRCTPWKDTHEVIEYFCSQHGEAQGKHGQGVHNGGSDWILHKIYANISNYGTMSLG
jgi:hypothetical protein